MQADALHLLDASRDVVNTTLVHLWHRLDDFRSGAGFAWRQVDNLMCSPAPQGSRQWRCEAETVGRILRGQAERKEAFETIQPLLTADFILPADERRPSCKNRKLLMRRVRMLRERLEEADKLMLLVNVVEQACNFYMREARFPSTYEEMQPIPLLRLGQLTYAADDGPEKGLAYRLHLDLGEQKLWFRFRYPDMQGTWAWITSAAPISLPGCVMKRLGEGALLAPTIREIMSSNGSRYAVLDVVVDCLVSAPKDWTTVERVLSFDWGVSTLVTATVVDCQQHQVSRPFFLDTGGLDGKQARVRRQVDRLKRKLASLPESHPQRDELSQEIERCWKAYGRRNRELAHLAANILLLLAGIYGCDLIIGEWLASLKVTERGTDVRGRWRRWRTNTTIRGELWRVLNIGRLGAAFLAQYGVTHKYRSFRMGDSHVNPVSYIGTGAVLPLPPPDACIRSRTAGKVYYRGWPRSVSLRSSHKRDIMLRLCG